MARAVFVLLLLAALALFSEGNEDVRGYARQLESNEEPSKDDDKKDDKDSTTEPPKEEKEAAVDDGADDTEGHKEDAASILKSLWSVVHSRMESHTFQWANALVAFAIGLALLLDSKRSFRVVVVACSGMLACVLTQSELAALWNTDHREVLSIFVGVQAGVVLAYAVHIGMEGMLIVIVGCLGGFFAFLLREPLIIWGVVQLQDKKWVVAIYYCIFAWVALYLYSKQMHRPILAFLCSLAGGALVTSAMAWTVTTLCIRFAHSDNLHPVGGTWMDFLLLLFIPTKQDLGLFAGANSKHQVDVVADRAVWFVLVVGGFYFQWTQLAEEKKKSTAAAARALEGLNQHLLVSEA